MNPWFVWNGKSSLGMGLWVSKLPEITRPAERVQQITIPGRAGELTMTEGDEVYNGYVKNIVVTCPHENLTEDILDWLRGNGELIVCTEDQRVYHARIASEVKFSRIDNSLTQATIPFYCEPFKYERYPQSLTFTGDGQITNPGNVTSKPRLTIQALGALAIVIGGTDNQMSFDHFPTSAVIDCDAGIITTVARSYNGSSYYYAGDYCIYQGGASGTYDYGLYRFTTTGIGSETQWEYVSGYIGNTFEYAWPGQWYGDFLKIPKGQSDIIVFGSLTSMVIEPRWRWI